MARWSYLIVAVYVVLAVGYAQEIEKTTKAVDIGVANTTTAKVETTSSEAPVTTTTLTTPPTTPPTTPSTTAKTTTTKATTTTTTQKPTTEAPTPKPDQPDFPRNVGKWLVNDTENLNNTCLALSAAIEVVVVEGTPAITSRVVVPTTANSNGNCSSEEVTIKLTWEKNLLVLVFAKNATTEKSALKTITVDVTTSTGNVTQLSLANQNLFEVPLNKSYKCTKETSIKIDSGVELKIASLQVEAFRQTAFDNYSAALECAIDDVSPVVPLAVGISLAVLVVIVLIAYLIGRSRSRARGYQSV